jgi:hypothetical protein
VEARPGQMCFRSSRHRRRDRDMSSISDADSKREGDRHADAVGWHAYLNDHPGDGHVALPETMKRVAAFLAADMASFERTIEEVTAGIVQMRREDEEAKISLARSTEAVRESLSGPRDERHKKRLEELVKRYNEAQERGKSLERAYATVVGYRAELSLLYALFLECNWSLERAKEVCLARSEEDPTYLAVSQRMANYLHRCDHPRHRPECASSSGEEEGPSGVSLAYDGSLGHRLERTVALMPSSQPWVWRLGSDYKYTYAGANVRWAYEATDRDEVTAALEHHVAGAEEPLPGAASAKGGPRCCPLEPYGGDLTGAVVDVLLAGGREPRRSTEDVPHEKECAMHYFPTVADPRRRGDPPDTYLPVVASFEDGFRCYPLSRDPKVLAFYLGAPQARVEVRPPPFFGSSSSSSSSSPLPHGGGADRRGAARASPIRRSAETSAVKVPPPVAYVKDPAEAVVAEGPTEEKVGRSDPSLAYERVAVFDGSQLLRNTTEYPPLVRDLYTAGEPGTGRPTSRRAFVVSVERAARAGLLPQRASAVRLQASGGKAVDVAVFPRADRRKGGETQAVDHVLWGGRVHRAHLVEETQPLRTRLLAGCGRLLPPDEPDERFVDRVLPSSSGEGKNRWSPCKETSLVLKYLEKYNAAIHDLERELGSGLPTVEKVSVATESVLRLSREAASDDHSKCGDASRCALSKKFEDASSWLETMDGYLTLLLAEDGALRAASEDAQGR